MTDSVVVEGYVRFRDGKKWKTRWVALRKPSPVADCLVLLVFKDKSDKAQGRRERASITLEDICGLEVSGQGLECVPYTLAVLCLTQAAVLGFDSKDTLLAWEVRIRYSLGEVHQFAVGVLPGTKLERGPATLHICNNLLALARDSPLPAVIGHWSLPDLRRYGPVPNGFVFEGGTRCGYWAGVFFLASSEGEHISFLFDCIVRGVSPSRSPFGLRPVLPDPSGCPVSVQSEEQVNQEAQELERRLSLLSHRYSTASSACAVGPGGGDDRSLSGSSDTSDTSRSDGSAGSRLTVWAEAGPAPGPAPGAGASDAAAAGPVGFARLTVPGAERLSLSLGGGGACGGGGGARTLAKPPRPLQEIGRQRSSDSGVATTGSHSSSSGSFSSYTGSLDGVPGEEDAPAAATTVAAPPTSDPLRPCTCGALSDRGHGHQVHLYATPRSVARDGDQPRPPTAAATPMQTSDGVPTSPPCENAGGVAGSLSPPSPPTHPGHVQAALIQSGDSRKSVVAPPGDTGQSYTSKTGFTVCSTCGGYKGPPYSPISGPGVPAIPDQGLETPACPSSPPGDPGRTSPTLNISEDPGGPPLAPGAPLGAELLPPPPPPPTNGPASVPKNGREKLASLLADLLGCSDPPGAGPCPPAVRTGSAGLYESMSPALRAAPARRRACASRPAAARPEAPPPREEPPVLYENCLKCIGEHVHPPLRFPPPRYPRGGGHCRTFPREGPRAARRLHGHACGATLAGDRRHGAVTLGLSVAVEEPSAAASGTAERCRVRPAPDAAERNREAEEHAKCEPLGSSGALRYPQETEGAVFVFPPEGAPPERAWPGDGVTYVNIPTSPASKKQLNYMELEIQEAGGPGLRGLTSHLPAQRTKGSSTKYALIDITATETAHKVGTQHALGRQEGLHALELRRRGAPQ